MESPSFRWLSQLTRAWAHHHTMASSFYCARLATISPWLCASPHLSTGYAVHPSCAWSKFRGAFFKEVNGSVWLEPWYSASSTSVTSMVSSRSFSRFCSNKLSHDKTHGSLFSFQMKTQKINSIYRIWHTKSSRLCVLRNEAWSVDLRGERHTVEEDADPGSVSRFASHSASSAPHQPFIALSLHLPM